MNGSLQILISFNSIVYAQSIQIGETILSDNFIHSLMLLLCFSDIHYYTNIDNFINTCTMLNHILSIDLYRIEPFDSFNVYK